MAQALPPHILIIDDYLDALEMCAMYLETQGYRVTACATGKQGLACARAERPDLILMDIQMPDMTGIDALAVLRADPSLQDVPVVAYTALAMVDEVNRTLAAGFDDVILKPCYPEDLTSKIAHLLATPPAHTRPVHLAVVALVTGEQ